MKITIRDVPISLNEKLKQVAKLQGYNSLNSFLISILQQYVTTNSIERMNMLVSQDERLISEVLERNTYILNLIKEDYLDDQT